MKAMIWKELRENVKWAVLAMIGLGLAEFYGLTQRSYSYDDQAATLCKSAFLMSTSFGCAAVGLVLGLLQILPEQRRDQWAALLHRPVTRATIFRGKAFAGTLLYLVATIPPFMACVWYAATPGHFPAPFVPQMVFPGIADICAGAMYYFAALFVGLRRGLWFGTRAFGFLAAVGVSFFVASAYYPLFRVPVEASILMALALFTAGWGTILTNGALRDQPWLGRFALVTVIFYGVCCLGDLTTSIIGMFSSPNYYYGTQYEMDIDGRPLKTISSKTAGTVITDLAGNVIQDKRFTSGYRYNYMLSFSEISTYIGNPHQLERIRGYFNGYRNNQTYLIRADGSYDYDAERWYYLPQERQFVGYFFKTNQRIGAIGSNGFHPGYEKAEPFTDHLSKGYWQAPSITQFGSTVYEGDFDQRRLTPIFSQPGTEVFGAGPLQSYQDQTIRLNWGAVALLDKMMVIDKTGQVIATLPYHQDMDRWGTLSVGVKPGKDRFYLKYDPSRWIDWREQRKMPSYFEEMDAKGTLLNTYTLPPIPEQHYPRSWQQYISEGLQTPAFHFGNIVYEKIGALCGSKRLADQLHETFGEGWGYFKDISIRISVISLVLAALTLVWARRMHFSWKRAWTWAGFVFAFNLAGLMTFRLVADWPVRVACSECRRKRPVEKELCPHCQSPWPVPQRSGIEIFDEKIPVAQTVA